MNIFDFLRDRIASCPSYGFVQGNQLLDMVLRAAYSDPDLTSEQYHNIIRLAHWARIKIMEDNYNEGWNQNP